MAVIDQEEFTRLWKDDGLSRVEIAKRLGVRTSMTHKLAVKFGLHTRRGYKATHANRPKDPTPAEIARMCEEIQAGWGPSRFERQCLARPRMYD